MGRVTGMLATVLCFAASGAGAAAGAKDASAPVAVVTGGSIRGSVIAGDVRAYLGVAYAAPPTGNLRWKAPQPVVAWSGVREATQFGHRCTQFGVSADMQFRDAGPSEDCLTLNVWAPAKAEKLPAKTGDPNGKELDGKGLPKWPAYDAKDGWMLMHLDAKSAAKRDELRERYLFLDGVWGK